jgi:hypothetical protein
MKSQSKHTMSTHAIHSAPLNPPSRIFNTQDAPSTAALDLETPRKDLVRIGIIPNNHIFRRVRASVFWDLKLCRAEAMTLILYPQVSSLPICKAVFLFGSRVAMVHTVEVERLNCSIIVGRIIEYPLHIHLIWRSWSNIYSETNFGSEVGYFRC